MEGKGGENGREEAGFRFGMAFSRKKNVKSADIQASSRVGVSDICVFLVERFGLGISIVSVFCFFVR